MNVVPLSSVVRVPADVRREIDRLLLRIRGLVFVRGLLEERGASELELERHRRETDRLRRRLAVVVTGGGRDAAA